MVSLDKFDIEILFILYKNNRTNKIQSYAISDIIEKIDISYSYQTFMRRLRKRLLESGFIEEGYKNGNSKTYFINEKGVRYVKDNVLTMGCVYTEISVDSEEDCDEIEENENIITDNLEY